MAELGQRGPGAIACVRGRRARDPPARSSGPAPCAGGRTPPARTRAARGPPAGRPHEADEHGVDVGHRVEDRARHRPQHPHVARELREHGRHAIGVASPPWPRSAARPPSAPSPPSAPRRGGPRPSAGSPSPRCRTAGSRRPSSAADRAPSGRGRARRRCAASCSVGLERLAQRRLQRGVDLHDVDVRDRRARCSDSTPRPPPISSTTSSGPSSAARSMTPRMFESMRKFCPRSRLGRTPNSASLRRLGWRHHRSSAAAVASTAASSSS